MTNFLDFVDLASERVGGAVLAANDEFFAPKENLIRAGEARWIDDKYTDRGKWMDGWETRRRREPGYDWVIIRLGLPGIVHGVVVDTRHFRGNFPESCSVAVCSLPGNPSVDEVLADDVDWREIVPKSKLEGHTRNDFPVEDDERVTHVVLNIYPDGGVARLRVHGEVMPDWGRIDFRGGRADLAAIENGGVIVATSDEFFGTGTNLLMPGLARNQGGGWQTRRRRGAGHDWAVVKLGARGSIDRVEVDTSHFKGNAPGSCSLEVCSLGDGDADQVLGDDTAWQTLLPQIQIQPNTRHIFDSQLIGTEPATHVRFNIFPDGGVARLRLYGTTERSAGIRSALARLNALSGDAIDAELLACCGSTAWAQSVAGGRPFGSFSALVQASDLAWAKLDKFDWLEAFAAHPRIGEQKEGDDKSSSWSRSEQSAVKSASPDLLKQLAEANQAYYDRFGHTYVVYAPGKEAEQLLDNLRERMKNESDRELKIAAEEQRKITRHRLGKLLRSLNNNNNNHKGSKE